MKKEITILIVNFNSSDFVLLSLEAIQILTKHPYQVFILDNGSRIEDYVNLKENLRDYNHDNKVVLERWDTNLRGSLAHGTALNYLTNKVDTPYFSILDADATWLIKNWDKILINRLDHKVKVIGTQAPVGSKKPQDFPLMFAALFETETFKKLNIDLRPKDLTRFQDTGWELRDKYLSGGYRGEILEMKNTRTFKKGPFKDVICGEYYLEGNPHIFATHFGRGSSLGVAKYSKGKGVNLFYRTRIPFISSMLRKWWGKREKEKWIFTCKRIIEEQKIEKQD